jgi:glycerophosphoryl diester phosphodiesterase
MTAKFNHIVKCFAAVLLLATATALPTAAQSSKNYLKFTNVDQLRKFFKYTGDGSIIISGHRGGNEPGYAENSIEGFQNVLNQLPAMFEIDPRLTKDSVIVLMHDATLDRTTTGHGNVSDYTWKELQQFRLKDHSGKVTNYRIPSLEQVIKWSKGKTIVNLDKKDVPLWMTAAIIKKYNAEDHVMLTVHTGAEARYYYDCIPGVMFSAFMRNDKEFDDMAISGVPYENMIAYVGVTIDSKNEKIVEKLHKAGVRCMTSLAPTVDQLPTADERAPKYMEEVAKKPDIIESDIPTEIWKFTKRN